MVSVFLFFPIKISFAWLSCTVRATFVTHPILRDFYILVWENCDVFLHVIFCVLLFPARRNKSTVCFHLRTAVDDYNDDNDDDYNNQIVL